MAWRFDMASDIGGRLEQQDRVAVFSASCRPGDHLAVLADGMGGRAGGAIAAQTVIDIARREFARDKILDPRQFLLSLCQRTHREIIGLAGAYGSSPGSTCTLLYLHFDEAYWIHVGDSRLYQFDAGRLVTHTIDHTVSELMRGTSPGGDNAGLPPGQRLYMCLGGTDDPEPEFAASALGRNSWFMLCSDGFWRHIDILEVSGRVMASTAAQEISAELVGLAARRAGPEADNITLMLARRDGLPARRGWRRLLGRKASR